MRSPKGRNWVSEPILSKKSAILGKQGIAHEPLPPEIAPKVKKYSVSFSYFFVNPGLLAYVKITVRWPSQDTNHGILISEIGFSSQFGKTGHLCRGPRNRIP